MASASHLNEFEARVYTDRYGNSLPYRLLKPRNHHGQPPPYPLVLFLHGAGEKGEDNARQVTNGAEKFAAKPNRERYPCYVVVPQCPLHEWWADFGAEMTIPLRLAFAVLDEVKGEFPVDERRRYITGVSMGGFGTWDAVSRLPEFFAAAVPVCGGGDVSRAHLLTKLPIWAFHGAHDTIVDPQYTREMIAAIRSEGGAPRYTEYPGVGHASWDLAYREPELFKWLFEQAQAPVQSRPR